MKGTVSFDIETHSASLLHTLPPEEMFRLGGYKWANSYRVHITTDLDEMREVVRSARWIIGHNIINFDLPVIFGTKSDEWVQLAIDRRVIDTFTLATRRNPAPFKYTNRFGKEALADSPERALSWYGLDEQAFQLGVQGKTHDLKALAFEFGDPELPKAERIADGFGKIPVDDPRFRDYLVGDVEASEAIGRALMRRGGQLTPYELREIEIEARKMVISCNGLRVDKERAEARVAELAERRAVIMANLVEWYGLPTEGDAPWATSEGKAAILKALADYGITPESRPDWPKTPAWENREAKKAEARAKVAGLKAKVEVWRGELASGESIKGKRLTAKQTEARRNWITRDSAAIDALECHPLPVGFGLNLGGDTLKELTKGTPAEELGAALAELKGQRSLAQLALDSMHEDGFVHPDITMLQASGRWSTTKPGLTVWNRDGAEKEYFVPDNENEVLLEIDYSNADARVVAMLSGDRKYAERFEEGADGHLINAWAAWGRDVVGTDKHNPVTFEYRQKAKPLGHGWSYGGGPKGLAKASGLPLEDAETFCRGMNAEYHVLVAWQDKVRKFAQRNGFVVNRWGRVMPIERGREFTQAPALMGQSGTREIVCDALLALPLHVLRRVKAQVHDALLFSVPKVNWEECRDYLKQKMTFEFPAENGGQEMAFPVDAGPAGANWALASH
ncbi:DNA polymerase [Amycolatopsis orientalis]|uniref:DNA polymerase n=1 Tax=Amycolatopsis orientalis TaxID=31958 RepID=UPI0003A9B580|nr:DNA polymerase [Amycolatopsis orientalis]